VQNPKPTRQPATERRSYTTRAALIVFLIALPLSLTFAALVRPAGPDDQALEAKIKEACSQCHGFPEADIKARAEWRALVNTMFHLANLELLGKYGRPIWDLDPPQVVDYYEQRAPEGLSEAAWGPAEPSPKLYFESRSYSGGSLIVERPGGANVQFFDLFEDIPGPEIVVCDMLSGWVSWTNPNLPDQELQPIIQLKNPCHSELVDLDQDGRMDLLISELGDPLPSDAEFGAVAFLRRTGNRTFELIRLIDNIGRVCDARAADFDGDGDLDVIVAEFGWRLLGSIRLLENVSTANQIRFESHELDPRHGTIHVPVVDLNDDGKPDILALISQEHEVVVAFLNQGGLRFRLENVYQAPHPLWGSSGMEPVDFDGDGDLDILMTNGDTLDDMKIRPWHGISWLENDGGFPFKYHRIDGYHGVHRAEPGDIDGDGDLDFAACSFLPDLPDQRRRNLQLSGVVWYERVGKDRFVKHVVADERCDFPTLELADLDGDGRLDVAVANLMGTPRADGSEPPLLKLFFNRPGKR